MDWRELCGRKRKTKAYQATFSSEEARIVLADLAIFCRETSTAIDMPGPIDMAAICREEGKRAVWLRIKNYLALDTGELVADLRLLRREILAEQTTAISEARTLG